MSRWSASELDTVGATDELRISSRRADGTLRPSVIIWSVRVGDDLFVRSASVPANPWFRSAAAAGLGHISSGGVEKDVVFEPAADGLGEAIDAAYHAKYDRYGARIVGSVVGEHSHAVTLGLVPVE